MTLDQAEQYLLAGGSLIMDTRGKLSIPLASAAAQGGGHLTLVGSTTFEIMMEIREQSEGHVTFDIAARS